ncbi:MAG: AEC family transporter [Desulfocapsaceae bacterium]|nr:AEC family transporter [Desulfocapsaceae bacterium]
MVANLTEILNIVVPVFLVIGLGYGIKWTFLINDEFLFALNRLAYYLALPSLLFYKIATADFTASFNISLVIGLGATVFLTFVLSYAFSAAKACSATVRGTFSQCAFRGNLAYVGLAIVFNAYGEPGLAIAGVVLGFIVPTLNFFSIVALLLPHRESRLHLMVFVRQIVFNPLIVASFLGIGWSFLGLPVPLIMDRALHIVTGMALPLALLSIGASFSLRKLRGDLTIAFLASGFKLLIMPIIGALILYLLGVRGEDLVIGILLAGTPTATAAYILSQQMRGDAELAGTIIMLTTLLSILSYSLLLLAIKTLGI